MSLSHPQYKFLCSSAEWALYGGAAGSGKTQALTLDPLRHCQGPAENRMFRGAIFRRTYPTLTKSGGLLDHCKEMYGELGGEHNHTRSEFEFPSGAKIGLSTIQFDKNLDDYKGAQFDWVAFDEVTDFPLKYVQFIWGRCRSKSGIKPTLRMSCNPDNDSWLFRWVYWWINSQTGLPIPERSGVIRHFRYQGTTPHWYDEPQYNDKGECITTSGTFVPGKLTDNTHLMESDPKYRQRLEQLDDQERERFLNGNWLASSKTETEWDRSCFVDILVPLEQFPIPQFRSDVVRMFSIDPSKGRRSNTGDYSAIICMAQTRENLKYVDCDMDRRPPGQIVEDLFLFCDQPHHRIRSGDLIGIESLQFQSLFREQIIQYAHKHPEYALSRYLRGGGIIIPVEDTLSKEMRIRRLDPFVRKRQFRFLDNPGTALLVSQLRNFNGKMPKGEHDDGPDALDQANQLPIHLEKYYENLRKGKGA